MPFIRSALSLVLSLLLVIVATPAMDAQTPASVVPKYKLTIVEDASTTKRVKKGRASAEAVVQVTDENNVPVAGIAVTFTISQLNGTGATFANGGSTSIATTNASGTATSGTFTAGAGMFSISAAASTPTGLLTAAIPITIPAALVGGTAISSGVLIGIIAAVGAGVGIGALCGTGHCGGGGGSMPPPTTTTTSISGTIGAPGTPTFGPHP